MSAAQNKKTLYFGKPRLCRRPLPGQEQEILATVLANAQPQAFDGKSYNRLYIDECTQWAQPNQDYLNKFLMTKEEIEFERKMLICTLSHEMYICYTMEAQKMVSQLTLWDSFLYSLSTPLFPLQRIVQEAVPEYVTLNGPIDGIKKRLPAFGVILRTEPESRAFRIDIGIPELGLANSFLVALDEFHRLRSTVESFIYELMQHEAERFRDHIVANAFKNAADAYAKGLQEKINVKYFTNG